ncbi:siderophore iron transporter [Penicillium angulare]|uniref:Siderophore iron transporter n=1 Tax=Penicillium angulare TaxID=116970 RepID=A0A9W9G173_9EURO|nr:siderophore iron transporter [Penicillium angulare]
MASEVEQSIALRFAFSIMWSKIGIVVGQSISGGTWTNVLPRELHHHLPPNLQSETKAIMGSIEKALSYPPGSVGREAIDDAYSHVQRLLTIIGTSMLAFSFLGVLIWRRPW